MAKYSCEYSEEDYGRIFFDAESEEQAEALLEQVQNGEITLEDLPNYYRKSLNGAYDIGYNLKEVNA